MDLVVEIEMNGPIPRFSAWLSPFASDYYDS